MLPANISLGYSPESLLLRQNATQIAFKGERIHDQLNAEGRMWLEEWMQPAALQKKGATASR